MRNSGVRFKFKESGSYKIGSKTYDIMADKEYCFLSMTPEECSKFKSSFEDKLAFFKVSTDTAGAYQTNIYQQVDRAKNFAKVAAKMSKRPKKSEKEIIEESITTEVTKSIEMLDQEPKLVTKNSEGNILTVENIPVVEEEEPNE